MGRGGAPSSGILDFKRFRPHPGGWGQPPSRALLSLTGFKDTKKPEVQSSGFVDS
jgi:hypothetical protein